MAQVPYKAYPTVEPAASPPHDYFQLQANPERFAAAAKGLEQFGGEVSKAADMWGQLQVDAQANAALKSGDELLNQLRNLHGQEQIEFANGLPQKIEAIVAQGGQGLSPVQQNRYRNIMAPYQFRLWNGEMATSQAKAANEVAHQTYENTVTEAGDRAARFSSNPDSKDFKDAVGDSVYAYQQLERFKGNENLPGTMENAERQGKLYAYKRAAEAMSIRDPVAAMKFTDDHKEELGAAYSQLAKEFHNKAEVMQSETRGDISQKANGIADPIAREGYLRAHANDLGPELFKSLMEQPPGAKPSAPAATPSDFIKQQIQQETQKPQGQPAQQPAQPTPQKPRVQIEVPLDGHIAMLSVSKMGRATLVDEAFQKYPPNTELNISGKKFIIPPAGTTVEIEGIKHTVPAAKTAAPITPTAPIPKPAATPAAQPNKSSQNYSPVQNLAAAEPTHTLAAFIKNPATREQTVDNILRQAADRGVTLPNEQVKLHPQFEKGLTSAIQDYKEETGRDVRISSLIRNREQQARAYLHYLHGGGLAAPPGHSLHEKGEAADLNTDEHFRQWLAKDNRIAQYGMEFLSGHARSMDPAHIQLARRIRQAENE